MRLLLPLAVCYVGYGSELTLTYFPTRYTVPGRKSGEIPLSHWEWTACSHMALCRRLEREALEASRFAGIDTGGCIIFFDNLLQRVLSAAASPDFVAPVPLDDGRYRILLVMAPISRQCMQHWRMVLVVIPMQISTATTRAQPPQPPDIPLVSQRTIVSTSLDLFFPVDYPLSPPGTCVHEDALAANSTYPREGTCPSTNIADQNTATSARLRQLLVCIQEYLQSLGCAGHSDWHPGHTEPPPGEDEFTQPEEYETRPRKHDYDQLERDIRGRRRRRGPRSAPRCTALRLILRALPALAPHKIPVDILSQRLTLRQLLFGAAQRADVLYLALGAAPQAATLMRAHGRANYQHFPDALRRLLASHAEQAKHAHHCSTEHDEQYAQPLLPLKVEIVLFDSASMLKHALARKRRCGIDVDIGGDGSEQGDTKVVVDAKSSGNQKSSIVPVLSPPFDMHCVSGRISPIWSTARGHWRSVRPRGALHVGQVLRVPTHEEVARALHEQALYDRDVEDGVSDASFADVETEYMAEAEAVPEPEVERRSWCCVAAAARCTARARSGAHDAVDWDEDKERVLGGTVRVLECSGPDCDDDDTVLLQLLRSHSTKACDKSSDAVQHHFAWLPRECLLRWSGHVVPSVSCAQKSMLMLHHGKLGDDGCVEAEWRLRGLWKAKVPANGTDGSSPDTCTDAPDIDLRVSTWRGVWQPYRHAAFLQCVAEELECNAHRRSIAHHTVKPKAGKQHRVVLPRLLIGCFFGEVDGKRTDLRGQSGDRLSASAGRDDGANVHSDVQVARSDSLAYAELAAVARTCPLVSLICSGSGGCSTLCDDSSGVDSARIIEWEWREHCRRHWCKSKLPHGIVNDITALSGAHVVLGAEVEGDTVWAAMLRRLRQRNIGDYCEGRLEEQRYSGTDSASDDEAAAVVAVKRVKAAERPELSMDDWARMHLGSTAAPDSFTSGATSDVTQVSGCCDTDMPESPWRPTSWAHLHSALSAPVDAEDPSAVLMPREHCIALTTARFAREYEDTNIPVVIDGLCDTWNFSRPPASPSQIQDHVQSRAHTQVPTLVQPRCSRDGDDIAATHVQYLTFAQLCARFPRTNWRFSDTHGETMSIEQYAMYVRAQESVTATAFGPADDAPLGLYDSQFGEQRPTDVLLDEYTVPQYFRDDLFRYCSRPRRPTFPVHVDGSNFSCDAGAGNQRIRPPFRWILVGPARSGTGLHVDPLWTSAWVTLLSGLKRWVLFPPQVGCDERVWGGGETVGPLAMLPQREVKDEDRVEHEDKDVDASEGEVKTGSKKTMPMQSVHWFMHVYPKLKREQQLWRRREERGEPHPEGSRPPPLMVELLQYPGQTVFVPQGWPHAVLNLSMSVALTHNYGSACGDRTVPVDDTASGTANIANGTHSGTLTAMTADMYGHGRSAEVLGGFTGICRACVRDEPVFWARLYRRLHIGRTELAEAARRAGLAPNGDVHTGLHGNDSISTTTTTTSSASESPASASDEGDLQLA